MLDINIQSYGYDDPKEEQNGWIKVNNILMTEFHHSGKFLEENVSVFDKTPEAQDLGGESFDRQEIILSDAIFFVKFSKM